jgi:hypothetical protein
MDPWFVRNRISVVFLKWVFVSAGSIDLALVPVARFAPGQLVLLRRGGNIVVFCFLLSWSTMVGEVTDCTPRWNRHPPPAACGGRVTHAKPPLKPKGESGASGPRFCQYLRVQVPAFWRQTPNLARAIGATARSGGVALK